MRYVFFANGALGRDVLRWLIERGTAPSGLVVHPSGRAHDREAIVAVAGLPPESVIEGPSLRAPEGIAWLRDRQPDWLISVLFGYVLRPDVLAVARRGAVNLHPALLPYNRGAFPNVWAILDKTPAGVTLHHIKPDEPVDAGDVIAQREVAVLPTDTGKSLYERLQGEALTLFKDAWPSIEAGTAHSRRQAEGGTYHRVKDVELIDRIDVDRLMRAGDVIDLLRARTFPPYRGAYIEVDGRRIYLRLQLSEESEVG